MTKTASPVLSFAKLPTGMPMPHLLDIQTRAFQSLLQPDGKDGARADVGLERVFKDLFPIQDVNGNYSLEFVKYGLGEPKYTVEECIERDMTYSVPLKATLQLVVMEEVGEVTKTKRPKNIIEKEVYLGELPILTTLSTFVINGAERVIVSQLLRAFGYGTNADILKLFYAVKDIDITGKLEGRAQKREVLGTLLAADVPDPENKKGEPLARVGDELVLERFNAFRRAGITSVKVFAGYTSLDLREDAQPTTTQQTPTKYVLAFDVADPDGEVVGEAGRELSDTLRKKLLKAGVTKVEVLLPPGRSESPLIKNTLAKDPTHAEAEALAQIYTLLRPGEAPNIETAREALKRLFFHPKRYDLGRVGRYKINQRLKVNVAKDNTVLTEADFVAIIRYLIELSEGRGYTDDIDHLGNRRVRSVGELIANQFSVGLSRMARLIKERMSINNDPERITLDDLVNARTVSAVIQAFFGSSQLSQFMDQTNPLAELTHKRRLSALGPGGLTRERAGFEVRDVHYSQYGRMCPIETPEGPNIGLITSLSCYARVNELGFIETPYRVVKDGKVTDETRWLSASEEEDYAVAQANAKLTPDGRFADELVLCRKRDDYPLLPPNKIDFMDVAPEQLVSIAAALIPFLEHDGANRALMGSNMQRQSVPLLFPQAPLVGTGLEEKVARDSGAVVIARRGGVVTRVTADEIIIDSGDEDAPGDGNGGGDHPLARLKQHDRFRLKKFWRTNQDTAINQRPLVQMGQKVKAGQIVADGAGTEGGDLALGANVTVESLVDLDERGIVRIGAHVKAGDILVGKITPKGETELSPEEKLLTAIFGEKAKDVKDSSLKVPPGMEGVVIDVKIFSRIEDQVVEKDRGERIGEVRRLETDEKARISEAMFAELRELLAGQEIGLMLKAGTVEEYLPQGTKLSRQQLAEINFADVDLKTLRVTNKPVNERIRAVLDAAAAERAKIEEKSEDQIDKILQPDELPPGVSQLVKVYVAEKRKISVGDKMAGRHGNKGIIARIVPEEDMPFLPDGSPVDIVLNPLGVPSRMNVGQILETHLGWAAQILGFEAKTPVFQGADETEIGVLLRLAGLTWAAECLRLDVRPPELAPDTVRRIADDLRRLPATNGGRPDLGKAGIELLASRALAQETRDVHHQFVDFLRAAAKELAERELAQHRIEQEVHAAKLEAADASNLSAAEKAALKAGAKEIEKLLVKDKPADVLEAMGRPALAALFGAKSEADVDAAADELLAAAGLSPVGKCRLRDGRTGELFESEVTVGSIYMMKLSHLVDDKIHARSIGPYSLVTQQPLAGKAQFGGQRFGEMEVWALEAYGAAHTLQEILTVKSDDVNGRSRVYEAIVKGQNLPKPGIPESFNVLVKELQALGLKVTLGTTEDVEE